MFAGKGPTGSSLLKSSHSLRTGNRPGDVWRRKFNTEYRMLREKQEKGRKLKRCKSAWKEAGNQDTGGTSLPDVGQTDKLPLPSHIETQLPASANKEMFGDSYRP